jgi:hypothetical protein
MYRRLSLRPGSRGSAETEEQIDNAMSDYLAGTGCFQYWERHQREGTSYGLDKVSAWTTDVLLQLRLSQDRNPLRFWKGFLTTTARPLAILATTIFLVVVNEAGCERVFSLVKETSKDRCNRLALEKIDKITKVRFCFLFSPSTFSSPDSDSHTLLI